MPKIIQAPQNIPSLFAFNRTTVYLLLGPDAPKAKPTSVMLRGTSAHGPLELEIPVQALEQAGETIHQMAAKRAISELEQGRGWLPQANDDTNTFLKTKFEGRFEDMVEREAVRLGVTFRVGGKWCSFVAIESNKKEKEKEKEKETEDWEFVEDESKTQSDLLGAPEINSGKLFQFSRVLFSILDLEVGSAFHPADGVEQGQNSMHSKVDACSFSPTSRRSGRRNRFIDVEAEVDDVDCDIDMDREDGVDDGLSDLLYQEGSGFVPDEEEEEDDDSSASEKRSKVILREMESDSDEEFEPPVKYLASIDQKTVAPRTGGMETPNTFDAGSTMMQAVTERLILRNTAVRSEADVYLPEVTSHSLANAPPHAAYYSSSQSLASAPQPPAASQSSQKMQAFFGSSPYQNLSVPRKRTGSALQSSSSSNSNHALQDYQMQTMLLEQQNKKRLLMARQEQDSGRTVLPTSSKQFLQDN